MEGLTPILLILLGLGIVMIFFQSRQVGALKNANRELDAAREDKRLDAENARKEARERREELERLRSELQDTKTKLKKKSERSEGSEKVTVSNRPGRNSPQPEPPPSTVGYVRISNQELEAQHQSVVQRMEQEIAALKQENAALAAREAERQRALERAKKTLDADQPKAAQVDTARRPEDQVEALKTQVEALSRASAERERGLKRELDRLHAELRASERRASANHQLYQVAKGQMAVIEDRMAALRRKHEGAISPDKLRKPAPIPEAAPAAAEAAPVAAEDVPATQVAGGERAEPTPGAVPESGEPMTQAAVREPAPEESAETPRDDGPPEARH